MCSPLQVKSPFIIIYLTPLHPPLPFKKMYLRSLLDKTTQKCAQFKILTRMQWRIKAIPTSFKWLPREVVQEILLHNFRDQAAECVRNVWFVQYKIS